MSENKKEKFSLKAFGNAFLDVLSSCLSPIIPVLISAAMFKTVLALLGPDMLNVITAESDLYVLLNFVGDAGFYFLPVILWKQEVLQLWKKKIYQLMILK